jgi:geranylgeranyl diphosphate synthase type II
MTTTDKLSFLASVESLRQLVDTELDRLTRYGPDCPAVLKEAIRHSLLSPGKRLRPMLVLMAARACGQQDNTALSAACAVEMIHTYSLIHDDLPAMDDDDLRRGVPTCHRLFGEANAILAGDALLAHAFEVLAGSDAPAETVARCCRELASAAGAASLVGGQADDLAGEDEEPCLDRLEAIHHRKTGAMFRVALRLGAIIGGGSDEQITSLETYGSKLGLAFQVTDDLLDKQGDEEQVGKRTGKDAVRGKLTFPGMLGEAESRRRASALIEEACQALAGFDDAVEPLVSLARFVLDREK